ncbi:MAG TPA: CsgG/HfaB family protein [Planctomycetota bacterium]|nr:CsgG/HfaB family protein [Planctomycetota bacterium]
MRTPILLGLLMFLASCVSPDEPVVVAGGPVAGDSPALAQQGRVLKRKVAVARFTNETQYGRGVFGGGADSPIEEQAADTLKTRLADTGRVVLIDVEGWQTDSPTSEIPADYVIVGSVSQFGRNTSSETGVFGRTKKQTAQAAVNLRLIRTSTGEVIYAEEGSGEASVEVGKTLGVGTSAGYDSTLNDKAISAAIGTLVSNIVENLLDDPWRTWILKVDGESVVIAGGKLQGLAPGDRLAVLVRGERIENPQFKTLVELPGKQIASLEVLSSFGGEITSEGSICKLLEGDLSGHTLETLVVESLDEGVQP